MGSGIPARATFPWTRARAVKKMQASRGLVTGAWTGKITIARSGLLVKSAASSRPWSFPLTATIIVLVIVTLRLGNGLRCLVPTRGMGDLQHDVSVGDIYVTSPTYLPTYLGNKVFMVVVSSTMENR